MATGKFTDVMTALASITWNRKVISSSSADAITTASTKKLSELGVLNGYGTYLVYMGPTAVRNHPDCGSVYAVYYASNNDSLNIMSTIKQGAGDLAVVMDSNGVVKRTTDYAGIDSIIVTAKIVLAG